MLLPDEICMCGIDGITPPPGPEVVPCGRAGAKVDVPGPLL